MKTSDFLRKHGACSSGSRWALSVSKDMADVWDALVDQGKHAWLFWVVTRPGVFSESALRKTACRFVRETPIGGGKTVWDLLEDARSRKAVEVSERYVDGNATDGDLAEARQSARAAASDAASNSARADFFAAHAAEAAACAADADAYYAASAAIAASNAARAADAARAAADADLDGAFYNAHDAARAARIAEVAARLADASCAAAESAQIKRIAELGNPFNKGTHK